MNKNNYCVIMAGGIGSRFWPMSRNAFPKQFLDILGTGHTLLQQTFNRFNKICPKENIYIVTNETYIDLVKKNLPQLPVENILGEPLRRNTAPCVSYAAFKIAAKNPDANIVVAPSDHIITKEDAFTEAINKGLSFTAQNDCLLTLGITPSRPDTGYGYIQLVDEKHNETNKIFKVKTFTEKPNLEMARFFLQSGEFVWNAGIFLWNLKSILKALKEHLPEMYHLFEEGNSVYNKAGEEAFIKTAYSQCTNISIDFGVMEKANNVYVMSADFGWSDLGTYGSLYEHITHDANKNAVVGKNVMLYDTKNCIVNMPHDKLVVLQGLSDYIVVEAENILLVCRKQDEQQIRQFVNDVKTAKGEKFV
ncbi:MAG: mannose-1-phosphate guanylyltransferase [Bacteroidetes bacterium]|nr:mannose-1-phosphate guanylyltransferase [Bacteroidota bacterium]MBX7239393.1 mannose-1-phosphate guanylyltransferase [Bacteroidia bacterium]MCC7513494.1 mannose-1-phosphate guanylyltransferase [Bacteroidia bacterium]MCW5918897.1 mannose-1-phosphate guanylyltransferase [Bacteroidota bacterium]HMU76387.1 mannose-1-phosphate guanylyltransferase [Bacteroidia bacterium]